MAQRALDEDPATSFRFHVELKNVVEGAFTECSGLNVEREVYKIQEGGVNDHIHMLPGRATFPGNIVLKRGIVYSDALWKWFQSGLVQGKTEMIEMAIILVVRYKVPQNKRVAIRWNVDKAFPVKWSGPTLNSGGAEVAVETIEIAHQGIKMECVEL